ncbi:MAG: LysR family transcriptional regulator [Bdellovibrionota bacterium]
MENFEKIDQISLRAFYFAAKTLSFTKAAQAAALTQSGISQHVARLEETLGVSLFLRVSRKVQLTEAGKKLKIFAESYLDQVSEFLENLHRDTQELKGLVRYAMPGSCLMTPHFPLLLNNRKDFLGIDLKVTLCHSPEVISLLLTGEIDFGFVTSRFESNEIEFLEFAKEEYTLVSAYKKDINFKSHADLKGIDFITYPGMDILFEKWQESCFPHCKKLKVSDLLVRGEINSLQGAITMAEYSVGAGIFPHHCVHDYLIAKKLRKYKSSSKMNSIYIVKIKDQKLTLRVKKVLDSFWSMV